MGFYEFRLLCSTNPCENNFHSHSLGIHVGALIFSQSSWKGVIVVKQSLTGQGRLSAA